MMSKVKGKHTTIGEYSDMVKNYLFLKADILTLYIQNIGSEM